MATVELDQVAKALIVSKGVMYGEFTLASGKASPFYVDLGNLRSFPDQNDIVTAAYVSLLDRLPYRPDYLVEVPNRATPLVTSMMEHSRIPQITPRLEIKDHGVQKAFYGVWEKNRRVVVVDDLITTGESLVKVIDFVREEGMRVTDALVLLDRQQGGIEALAAKGVQIHALGDIPTFANYWYASGLIDEFQFDQTRKYFNF